MTEAELKAAVDKAVKEYCEYFARYGPDLKAKYQRMAEEVVTNSLARDMDLMPLVFAGHVKATKVFLYRMQWRSYILGLGVFDDGEWHGWKIDID